MRKIFFYVLFVITLASPQWAFSADTLTLETYLDVVISNHPLIKKAELYDELQTAYNLKGRGALDPKLNSDYQTKGFKEIDYFTTWNTEAKIPTVLPIDFAMGYERNDGTFLNPENSVPSNGLVYGTVNISLLRGLLFDDQRYQIQQASLDGVKTQLEKEILVREVLYQAVDAYLEWAKAVNQNNIYESYFDLINTRHQNVIQLFINGDKPAIDTTESRLSLNTAEKYRLNSNDYLIQKKQKLSLFIWGEDGSPLEIRDELKPIALRRLVRKLQEMTILLNPNFNQDPYAQKIENEVASLELEMRLDREQLKPELNLKYNTILNLGDNDLDPTYALRDYKYGVSFNYPILNRKTRGNLKLKETKIDQNYFDKSNYIAKLTNRFEALQIRQNIQSELTTVLDENIDISQELYEAEQLKYSLGESFIFLLNQREQKLLDSQMELLKNYEALGKIFNELYYLKLGQV